jgi:hypothetical protein
VFIIKSKLRTEQKVFFRTPFKEYTLKGIYVLNYLSVNRIIASKVTLNEFKLHLRFARQRVK